MNRTLAFCVAIVMIILATSVLTTKMRLEGDITRADGLLVLTGATGIVLAVGLAWAAMMSSPA